MTHQHQLLEIPAGDWPALRDLFAPNWPKHILGYSIVRNFIEWREKNAGKDIRNLKFYSLDGDWQSDGTFLVVDRYQLFLYSLVADGGEETPTKTRLEVALGLLDWTNGFKVSSFSTRHRYSVFRTVESKKLKKEFDSQTIFYHLPRHCVDSLPERPVPLDVVLKPLSDSDIPLAESFWPNRHSGSVFFLRRLCKWNANIGAFKKLPDGTEVLMGCCFLLQAGAMGALQVREEFQGQGIGTLITIAMCKLLRDLDKDAFGFVGHENVNSRKLFDRLQFEEIDTIHWLRTFPVGKTESIWDGDQEGDL